MGASWQCPFPCAAGPSTQQHNSQHPLSSPSKKLGRLPRLTGRTCLKTGLLGLSYALEIGPLWLRDPTYPAAILGMEEPGATLGDERLSRRSPPGSDVDRRGRIEYGVGQGKGAARSRRRLGGESGGCNRGRRVGLVHLEIGLDRFLEFVTRPSELAHGAAQRPPELWQVLRTEDEEGDHEDE